MNTKNIIIITGGTSGIGLATAKLLARDGFYTVLLARDEEKGKQAEREIENSTFISCDCGNSREVEAAVKKAAAAGNIKGVVISAGQYREGLLENTTDEEIDSLFRTNTLGAVYTARAVIPFMKSKGGSMVFVSSDAALRGNVQCSLYSATKGAMTAFARSLALELAVYPIRVNVVAPGDINTPLLKKQYETYGGNMQESAEAYPLMRVGEPEEVGEVICFLLSDKASFMTGSIISVDGGLTDW